MTSSFIRQIVEEIIGVLSSTIEDYVTRKDANISDFEHNPFDESETILLNSKLISYAKGIYRYLNLSALCGEYVGHEHLEEELDNLIQELANCSNLVEESPVFLKENRYIYILTSYIKRDIKKYKQQIHFFRNSVEKPELILIDYDVPQEEGKNEDFAKSLRPYSEVFFYNLSLVHYDREFALNPMVFFKINEICHSLHSLRSKVQESYVEALIHKCKLLEAKFYYCNDISPFLSFYNHYDGSDQIIDLRVDEISEISKRLREINTRDEKKYVQNITAYFNTEIDTKSTFYYFIKCHYYKNVDGNEAALLSLIQEFESQEEPLLISDKRNHKVCQNYFRNCLLSLRLKNKALTPNNVKNLLAQDLSSNTYSSSENHFPYYKTAQWYSDYLSSKIASNDIEESLLEILDELNNCINKVDTILVKKQRDAGCFVPFKPYYNECIETFNDSKSGDTIKIFLSTSFIVPVDFQLASQQVEDLKSKYIRLRAIIESSLSTLAITQKAEATIAECKASIKDLKSDTKKELSDNLKNSIQILAIFACIVLFAAGDIQIFKTAQTIKEAAVFMIMFAASLGLVGLLIRNVFVSRQKWCSRDWVYVGALVAVIAMTAITTLCNWGSTSINQEIETSETVKTESVIGDKILRDTVDTLKFNTEGCDSTVLNN